MAPQRQAGGKLGLRAASSEKRRRWNRIHCHWYRTHSGIAHKVVSYTMDAIVIIVDSIGHYCIQSKVAQCVGRTLHSGKIDRHNSVGAKTGPTWFGAHSGTPQAHSGIVANIANVVSATFYCTLQVLQLSVYSKSVWPGPNTAPATSCQRRSKCLVSQTFCKSLLLCRSKCQRTPTGVT